MSTSRLKLKVEVSLLGTSVYVGGMWRSPLSSLVPTPVPHDSSVVGVVCALFHNLYTAPGRSHGTCHSVFLGKETNGEDVESHCMKSPSAWLFCSFHARDIVVLVDRDAI